MNPSQDSLKIRTMRLQKRLLTRNRLFGQLCIVAAALLPPLACIGNDSTSAGDAMEPNVNIAKQWWPEPLNVWTPIGWKDHLFRFNVVYNGTILCEPCIPEGKANAQEYRGQDFQLTFYPSSDGSIPQLPEQPTYIYKIDGGRGIQGWNQELQTPVLWTEWRCQEGIIIRQEVFAHVKGAKPVETATEPLYAWIRLSVTHVDEIRAPKKFGVAVQLSKIYDKLRWVIRNEDWILLEARPELAPIKEGLRSEAIADANRKGMRILESDGQVRVQVLPTESSLTLKETGEDSRIYSLFVELPVKVGAHVDMVVPMIPQPANEVDTEARLGREQALAQCEEYWNQKPKTAANIDIPEDYVNQALRRSLQFAEIVAEKSPETGLYSFLTGSYGYDMLWSTPTSMMSHMFLDLYGYHDVVDRHIQIYKAEQGTVKPPGPSYKAHPGYFSTPKNLTSVDWLTDHGAIMEIISRHALMTGDKQFIQEWTDPLIKACEFIRDSCAATDHDGAKGVMPPAVATDSGESVQAIWSEAWNHKGLATTVRLLEKIGHPRASEFAEVAENFRKNFDRSFRERAAKEPTWTDSNGVKQPKLPLSLIPIPESRRNVLDEPCTLDTGALVLPWAELMDANDPLIKSYTEYFRSGPNHKLRGPRAGAMDRPVLTHEMSSFEPCYSWNIVNSWLLGDRENFIEGMYSLLVGALSPQTFIAGECRHGMYGNLGTTPLVAWCIRQAVVDDQLASGELHLLRLCPLAWISKDKDTVFENMPTMYGPVDLRFRLSDDGKNLEVSFKGNWREQPTAVSLHVPPIEGLEGVVVNGKWRPGAERIDL